LIESSFLFVIDEKLFFCFSRQDQVVGKNQYVSTIPGAGTFQRGGNLMLLAYLQKLPAILRPVFLVKIGGQQPGGVIFQ